MRKEFTLLDGELAQLQSVTSRDELVATWSEIGAKLGFDPTSATLVPGNKTFTAEEASPTMAGAAREAAAELGAETYGAHIMALSDAIDGMVRFAIVSRVADVGAVVKALTTTLAMLIINGSPDPSAMIENATEIGAVLLEAVTNHASGNCSCGKDHGHDA